MIDKRKLLIRLAPSLDVLWSMHLEIQQHECVYARKLLPALDGLLMLLEEVVRNEQMSRQPGHPDKSEICKNCPNNPALRG